MVLLLPHTATIYLPYQQEQFCRSFFHCFFYPGPIGITTLFQIHCFSTLDAPLYHPLLCGAAELNLAVLLRSPLQPLEMDTGYLHNELGEEKETMYRIYN